ncbi:tetratricopeptide repeat protein [Kitasatospora sp. YST-16]|uniref:tetratricopeptide repeat protein n=1 Tax=Kitasatospora sp. YST-16 TaxID=2998080 RepID=UPI0022852656|nr:tetratricopeptide repeat protein [Kitasatospora sp. YST-16]WAL74947.1 tetratricopeptide repeat protein [Kitasatospora sp. YST-16]WNW41003.1 tetratricopeptide repeat protein [Streptomyces sp. Li-HN-5-13]
MAVGTGERRGELPDPAGAADLAEFVGLLGELRAWAGMPSYRSLARRVGPLLRPAREVSASTLADVFKPGRRRLDLDLVTALVRALGAGEDEVGRWRASGVRVHREAKSGGPSGVLHQLPADLAVFTGRERELQDLLAAAPRPGSPAATVVISSIEGMGGVGKTRLAVHAAHLLVRAGRFADVQLYVNLYGFDPEREPADPAEVLASFLRQLGVPAASVPSGADERAAMFRDRLQDRAALLLLDNAADEEQVRDLIPAHPGCLVLVTGRRSLAGLDGARIHQLDVLEDAEAVELLAAVAGRERIDADRAASARVARACGNLPLALTIAGARLKARPAWTAADLLVYLDRGGLDAMTVGRRSLRPVFDLSLAALPRPARLLFLLLGIQPGADVTAEAAAALAGVTVGTARATLEALCDEYLLLQLAPGRFELHDILRAYASETAVDRLPAGDRERAVGRLLDWYGGTAEAAATALLPSLGMPSPTRSGPGTPGPDPRHPGTPGPDPRHPGPPVTQFVDRGAAVAWLEAEHGNLLAAATAARAAGHPAAAWRIPAAASVLRAVNQNWPACEALLAGALAEVLRTGDLAAQAWLRNRLGATATELGRTGEAEEMFTEALAARRALGDRDGEAAVLNNLVIFYSRTDRPRTGLEHASLALELAREQGNTDREASALNAMAACQSALGRNAAALELMQQVVAIRESRGDGYRLGLAYILTGSRHHDLGQFEEAAACNTRAREIARRSGDRFGEGEALLGLAKSLLGQGRPAPARDCLREAVAVFDELAAERYLAEARRLLTVTVH